MSRVIDLRSCALFCFYSAGVIGTLVIYGLLQERIMAMPYGTPPALFSDTIFLVFCNRVVAAIFALFMVVRNGEPMVNAASFWKYLAISFASVYASACQYEALKFVSFPVQMLGKSFKMMPVMCWGILVSSKCYGLADWITAVAVTAGVTEFVMTGPITEGFGESSQYGILLLGCFLALDGFTYTFQEKLFKDNSTSKYNQMLYINVGSCLISLCNLLVSDRFWPAISFAKSHPAFVAHALTLSGAAVAGQWFIYSQVMEFGALVFAATMNVRQVVSILLSYAAYGHSSTPFQVLGLLLVFSGLFYQTLSGLLWAEKRLERRPLVLWKAGVAEGAKV